MTTKRRAALGGHFPVASEVVGDRAGVIYRQATSAVFSGFEG